MHGKEEIILGLKTEIENVMKDKIQPLITELKMREVIINKL